MSPPIINSRFTSIDAKFAARIAKDFASPVYIMDEIGLKNRLADFQSLAAQIYPNSIVAVSYKTNPTRALLADLHRMGAYAEVVSSDELQIAKSLNVPLTQIIFNGPAKSDQAISDAIAGGCFIHCDHEDELVRIESIARQLNTVAAIGLRLHLPAEESWERFGFMADAKQPDCDAFAMVEKIGTSSNLQLRGLHSHIGTNIRQLKKFCTFGQQLADFATEIRNRFDIELQWIDVGGGLAGIVPLASEHATSPFSLPAIQPYLHAVVDPLMPYLDSCHRSPKLFFEPGRTLFNAFGALLTTVIGRRPPGSDGVASAIMNAGITSLALAAKYDLPIHVCRERHAPIDGDLQPIRLLGPTCIDYDVIGRPATVPELLPGDHVIVYGTGCYNMALATSFTHFRIGTVGWVDHDEVRWLRKPETIEHSMRLDS